MNKLKAKFESIDQSKLTDVQKSMLGKMKKATNDFSSDNKELNGKIEIALDNVIKSLSKTNPEAIKKNQPKNTSKQTVKKEPRVKREPKAKKNTTTEPKGGKPKGNSIFDEAKRIRKEGEAWKDALERAKENLKKVREDEDKKIKSETEKLLAFIKRRKELQGIVGTTIKKDSKIQAKPKGRRISKNGKIYYEHRDNRTDRLAPDFKDKVYLESGGKTSSLKSGVYRVGKPIKLKENLYEQKIVEIFDNGDIATASDYGKRLSDFKSMKYPIISKEKLESMYLYGGDFFEKGGYVVIALHEKGGGFVMSKPSTYDKSKKLMSLLSKIDGETNKIMTVEKASKIEGLVGKEYLKYADGGSILGVAETPLAHQGLPQYSGLVGETGALSSGEMFANGGTFDTKNISKAKKINIKNWYTKTYPTDDLGAEINPDVTLWDLWVYMSNSYDVYNVLEVHDSLVRERVFEKLSETLDVDYDVIYSKWLASDNYELGGTTGLPAGAEQHFVNYYLGEGASAGMFANGGSIENQYEGKSPEEVWNMLSYSQKYHFLSDHSKEIESTPASIEKATKTAFKFLPIKIKNSFKKHISEGQYAKGGGVDSLENNINKLYLKSGLINTNFNWRLKLLEMLQDNSIEAYTIYEKLTKEQKYDVLQEQFKLDNDMGSYGDGDIETTKENLQILLDDAKNGKKYAKGGSVDYYEQLAVYVQGKGSIYNGTSMKKALEKANSYLKNNPKAEIAIVDEKYGDEYDFYGNLKDDYAKGGKLKSALMRDRNNFNHFEKHEIRYSKNRPHRKGYGYEDGGKMPSCKSGKHKND